MILDFVVSILDFVVSILWIVELAFAILGAYTFFVLTGRKGPELINVLREDENEVELDVPEFMRN